MYDSASKLYNELLEIDFDECCGFSDAGRKTMDLRDGLISLTLKKYDCTEWFKKKKKNQLIHQPCHHQKVIKIRLKKKQEIKS